MQEHTPRQLATARTQAGQPDSNVGAEWSLDWDRDSRATVLLEETQRRRTYREETGPFSDRYILEVAGLRYFELVTDELRSLSGFLTESELVVLLNTTASPVWDWRAGFTLAGVVADDQGIESLEDDTPMGRFVQKLSGRTQAQ